MNDAPDESSAGPPDTSPAAGSSHDADVTEQLAQLRAENEALRTELEATKERGGMRRVASIILAVVGAILVPVSVVTVWTANTALDTDQYVETLAPLATNEAVTDRVTEVVTEQVISQLDVQSAVEDVLPDNLGFLSGPITGGVESVVSTVVDTVVTSDAFATLWEEANRRGHSVAVAVLSGEGADNIDTSDGRIVVDLSGLVEQVAGAAEATLGEDFVARLGLDSADAEFVLLESDDLARAQSLVRLLDTLSWFVPIVTVLILLAAALLAPDRRKGLRRVGLAFAISSLIALLALRLGINRVVDSAQDEDAATAVVETLTRFLSRGFRATLVLGLVLLIVAWVTGTSKSGHRVRTWGATFIGRASEVDDPSAVGGLPIFVARYRRGLQGAAVVLAGMALVFWTRPTGWVVISLATILVLVVAGIEILGRIGLQAADAVDEGGADDAAVGQDPEPADAT